MLKCACWAYLAKHTQVVRASYTLIDSLATVIYRIDMHVQTPICVHSCSCNKDSYCENPYIWHTCVHAFDTLIQRQQMFSAEPVNVMALKRTFRERWIRIKHKQTADNTVLTGLQTRRKSPCLEADRIGLTSRYLRHLVHSSALTVYKSYHATVLAFSFLYLM
jgi:hypothetical protein